MTGAELVAAIRAKACECGVPLHRFALPLNANPKAWLAQMERAITPKPHTVERVMALLEGRDVSPPPPNNFQLYPHRAPAGRPSAEPSINDAPPPVERDPCFYCGTRADVGCRHRRTA